MLTIDFDKLELCVGDYVLDIGCGFGRHAYGAAVRGASVVACDLLTDELSQVVSTAYAMKLNNELDETTFISSVAGDVCQLPFMTESFDKVVASEVLEHVLDDKRALEELFRVLKPGGTLAVTVPSYFPEKLCWMLSDEYHAPKAVGGHVRIYTKKELRAQLGRAGFIVGGSHFAHALHSPYWWLKCFVGPNKDGNPVVDAYHKFLCWDLMKQPALTVNLEKLLNPVLGKSLVIYAQKPNRSKGVVPEKKVR